MDNVTLIRVVSGLFFVLIIIVIPLYALLKKGKVSVMQGVGAPYLSPNGTDRFVVPRGAVLPARCVKCASTPTEPWLQKTFRWHSPALVCLLFLGMWPYLIVAAIVQKKIRLAVPLCDSCKARRKSRILIGVALLVTCIPVPWAFSYLIKDQNTAILSALLLAVVMLIVGLMFVFESPLKPTHIGRDSAEFKGACPDFLTSLQFHSAVRAFGAGQQR